MTTQFKINEPRITEEISQKNIDSKIITFQHAELISTWIDKIDKVVDTMSGFSSIFAKFLYKPDTTTYKSNSLHEFKLIFRGSRDGFTPKKFHEICDDRYLTL